MQSEQDKTNPEQATADWTPRPEVSSIEVGDTHTNAPGGTHAPRKQAGAKDATPQAPPDPSLPQIPGYEMLNRVASGGMGVVYRARDLTLDRIVALKVPRAGFLSTNDDKDRFLLEARAAARLRHPNICPIYEVKDFAGQPYFSMAYIDGLTLRDWWLEHQPGPRQVAEIMATLAAAVHFAHEQKVVHRDLKPSNVMVEKHNSQPLLMDFGLAKDLRQDEGLTASGDVLGTPAYMAPEQAAGRIHEIGPASDVYSLGAILYELLAGVCPFQGTVGELLVKVQSEEPRSIRKLNPQVHADLETICQKAMAKLPAERYASAAELGADLERFARGDAILARRQSWIKRAWRQASKNQLAVGLGACLLIVVLGLAIGLPTLSKNWRASRLSSEASRLRGELDLQLREDRWQPANISQADTIIVRLDALSPEDAKLARAALAARFSEYIKARTKASRLDDQAVDEIEEHLRALHKLDVKLAAERRNDLDVRLGKWQRIATLQPPFENVEQELPGAIRKADGSALSGAATSMLSAAVERAVLLSPESSQGNYQLEARFLVPPKTLAALIIGATERHAGPVTALAVSPDGAYFASADHSGDRIRVFKSEDGTELKSLPGHNGPITGIAFSPDGNWFASAGWDGELHLFRWAERKLEKTFKFAVSVQALQGQAMAFGPPVAFDRTSRQLMVGSGDGKNGGEIVRWSLPDFAALKPLRPTPPTNMIAHLAAAREADRVAAGTMDNRAIVWDLASEKTTADVALEAPGVPPNLSAMACNPAGNLVAATCRGIIYLRDNLGKDQGELLGFAAGCYALQFNSEGTTLAAGYESGTVKLWDVAQKNLRRTIPDRRRRCLALAFGPKGDWLIGGVEHGTLHFWEASTGQERYALDGQGYRFLVDRQQTGPAMLRILRGTTTLREQTVSLEGDVVAISARRQGDLLELLVNKQPALIFHDYFPPRAMTRGHWGVLIGPQAEMMELIVRQSLDVPAASPLERGDQLLQAGAYSEAWELFDQQVGDADSSLSPRFKNEAALKSALSLRRLSRENEARERLKRLSDSDGNDPAVVMARYELLDALIAANQYSDAEKLFSFIRHTHTPAQIAEVVPLDFRRQMQAAYAAPLMTRRGFVQAGTLARLKLAEELAEFNQLAGELGLEWRTQLLTGLRMDEQHEAAKKQAATILAELEADLMQPDMLVRHGENIGKVMQRYGLVCRMTDQPRRCEPLLDSLLYDPTTKQLLPEVSGPKLALVLEKARVQAAAGGWSAVVATLQPLLAANQNEKVPRIVRGNAALLHGVALRHLKQDDAARTAWQAHPYPPLTVGGRLDFLIAPEIIQLWMLRSLANDLTSAEADTLASGVKLRLGGESLGIGSLVQLFPLNDRLLQQAWQSTPGLRIAEEAALGNRLLGEEVPDAIRVGAFQVFRQGAFGESWSAEQQEVVWSFTHESYLAYGRDQVDTANLSQMLIAWKGLPPFFGWKSLVSKLPPHLQGRGAYVIGSRRSRQGNAADAKVLWELARELGADDPALQKLVAAALQEKPAP